MKQRFTEIVLYFETKIYIFIHSTKEKSEKNYKKIIFFLKIQEDEFNYLPNHLKDLQITFKSFLME